MKTITSFMGIFKDNDYMSQDAITLFFGLIVTSFLFTTFNVPYARCIPILSQIE